jgi:hypothetical protein
MALIGYARVSTGDQTLDTTIASTLQCSRHTVYKALAQACVVVEWDKEEAPQNFYGIHRVSMVFTPGERRFCSEFAGILQAPLRLRTSGIYILIANMAARQGWRSSFRGSLSPAPSPRGWLLMTSARVPQMPVWGNPLP